MQSGFSSSSSDAYGQSNCWAFKHPQKFTVWCAFLFESWIATLITLSECVLIKLFMLIRLISHDEKLSGFFTRASRQRRQNNYERRSTTSKWNSVFNCRFSAINPGENKRKVIKQSMINQRVRQSTSWLWWEFYWKPTKSVFLPCVVGRRSLLILSSGEDRS